MKVRALATIAGLTLATAAWPQTGIALKAATAGTAAKPEVRLRWQIARGWVPAGGFRLYRQVGGARKLVIETRAATDATVDGLFGKVGKGRQLWSLAHRTPSVEPTLSFIQQRPPSAAAIFQQRKSLLGSIMAAPGPAAPRAQKNQKVAQLNASFGRGGAKPPVGRTVPALPAAPTPDSKTAAARSELHLAAMINPSAAELVGLGATDREAKPGEVVTYTLHSLTATKQESAQPVATLSNFRVGADTPPPAPTGLAAYQDDEEIALRWDRLPAATEFTLLQASYRVYRIDPGKTAPTLVSAKPVVILALEGDLEPVAFFTDKLTAPGAFTYQVALIDGFGRESARASLAVTAVDWRRPGPPPAAGASILELRQGAITKGATRKGFLAPTGSLRPSIYWIPPSAELNSPVKYHIYRLDLDVPTATPVRITAAPIDGEPAAYTADSDFQNVVVALFGADFFTKLEADEIAAASAPAATAASIAKRNTAVQKIRIRNANIQAKLKTRFKTNPPRKFEDATAGRDKRFSYSVVALYPFNGLESEEAAAGSVGIPDRTPPPAVAGGTGVFREAPARAPTAKPAPLKTSRIPYVGAKIRSEKAAPRVPAPKSPTSSFAGLALTARRPLKLALPPKDHGGTLELTWTGLPNLKDVRYLVRRRLGAEAFADVGISAPNQARIVDSVPRARARTYDYEVTALTRWNVKGPPAVIKIQVPSTVNPDPVNLLSVRPGAAEGTVEIRFESHSTDQSVNEYQVLCNGQPAKTAAPASAVEGVITVLDSGKGLGAPLKYTVLAVAGLRKSPPSVEMSITLKKLSAAAPAQFAGVATPNGVRLTWTAAANTTYSIKRRAGANGPSLVIAPKLTGGTYLDTSAIAGVAYTYAITAVDGAGNVSPPATANVTG